MGDTVKLGVRTRTSLERAEDALLALGRRHTAVTQRQLDVFKNREIADQVERLKNEPDLAVADTGSFGKREALDWLAVEEVGAVARRVQ